MKAKDLEQEYWDNKAFYAGCSAKNSPQDYIYRICSRYSKRQKLDTILKSIFDRKPVLSKKARVR